jgi:ribonucleotide reductase beta subunit family protein with ferritin-like domain
MEDRRWFDLYPRKFRVDWIEEEVMFPRDHKRWNLQDGTRSGIEPPVTQLFAIQVFGRVGPSRESY